jgi:hypothetical protein
LQKAAVTAFGQKQTTKQLRIKSLISSGTGFQSVEKMEHRQLPGNKFGHIDLSDAKVLHEQRRNIARFRVLWRRTMVGFVVSFAVLFFGGEFVEPEQSHWFVLLMFVLVIPTVFFGIRYKCPHCGTAPMGTSISIGGGQVAASRGIHPFPKRCTCCGYYLSEKALKADIGQNRT